MTKAFVFGKFLPFHKGHEAMINFALNNSDFLTVLVCCSDKESIPPIVRKSWVEKTFEHENKIEVKMFEYRESELPNTSESSIEVSEIWARIFRQYFPDYSLVITSEEYGDFVAALMNIRHIPFDMSKKAFPVSATAIRKNMFTNWKFLPESVKPDFAIKVVLLGTESTGKTTLAERLAEHFKCGLVSEVGREIIKDSKLFTFNDLRLVSIEHAKRINNEVLKDSRLVIIDTDIHTTISYSIFTFGKMLDVSENIYNSNKASLYLYLNNDVEYIQDGTRLNKERRNLLDFSHRKILKDYNIDIVEIHGDWEERFDKAVRHINDVIVQQGQKQYISSEFPQT